MFHRTAQECNKERDTHPKPNLYRDNDLCAVYGVLCTMNECIVCSVQYCFAWWTTPTRSDTTPLHHFPLRERRPHVGKETKTKEKEKEQISTEDSKDQQHLKRPQITFTTKQQRSSLSHLHATGG